MSKDTNLFRTLEEMHDYVFCIVDNGGATCDRFTMLFCDGNYFDFSDNPCHPQGVGMWNDSTSGIIDYIDENILNGKLRYLRFIDLPDKAKEHMLGIVNYGFSDFIKSEVAAASRDKAAIYEGGHDWLFDAGIPIYKTASGFAVRDDENGDTFHDTFREAVLSIMPMDYDLTGPEYHSPVDIWDESGGPVPLWDIESDPAVPVDCIEEGIHEHK